MQRNKMLSFLLHHRLSSRLLSTSLNTKPNPSEKPKPLGSLIKSIIKEQNPDALVDLFNASSSDPRFRFQATVYDVAVRRLAYLDRPDAVESILEHQKTHPEFATSDGFRARLILLYGRARMPDHALSTFRSLPSPRSALSFNALLTAFARAGGPGTTDRIAGLIQEASSLDPSVVPTVVSYNIIISVLCDNGELDSAMATLDLMEKKGVSPDLITYNTLLNGVYTKGRFDDGERIWAKMGEKDVRSYNAKMRGLVFEGRVSDAVEVFDEMKRVGVRPDVFSFNALIKGYCRERILEEAKSVYLALEENGCEPNNWTFKVLIPAVWEAREFDFVVRLCNESINYGCYLDVELLQMVVDGLAKESMYLKAKKLVKHVRSKSFYGKKCLRVPLPCLAV